MERLRRLLENHMGITRLICYATILNICFVCEGAVDNRNWYIYPPSNYEHLKNSREDKVYCWMQGQPLPNRRHDDLVEPSPYSMEQWIKRGRDIEEIEHTLLSFYREYTGEIRLTSILDALRYVATFRSVPDMLKIVNDARMDDTDRSLAAGILGLIGSPDAVEPLISLIERTDVSALDPNQPEFTLICNCVGVLADIGDPRAVPAMQHFVDKANLSASKKEYYLNMIDIVNENRSDYVANWILRWHLGNEQKNSKGLPYFISKKKWIDFGKQIPEVDHLLIDLYMKSDSRVTRESVVNTMGCVGSKKIASFLCHVALTEAGSRGQAISALQKMGADTEIRSLIDNVLKADLEQKAMYEISDALLSTCPKRLDPEEIDKLRSIVKSYLETREIMF